jgi:hypothetical protein
LPAVADFIAGGGMSGAALPTEFSERAERARRIFTGDGVDEPLPADIAEMWQPLQTPAELREWILASCNYTPLTLDKRLASISKRQPDAKIKVHITRRVIAP